MESINERCQPGNIRVYILHSFAKTPQGGNPAGVVLDADTLSEKEMQRIAALVGFSETAFVLASRKAAFQVRFFTPKEEVDLCGHATIAVFSLLAALNRIGVGICTQETKAGILQVENYPDGSVFMNQKLPEFYERIDKKDVAESLNISENLILGHLPVQIVSTGIRDIQIPLVSLEALHSIKPDFERIAEISKKYSVVGYHAFSTQSKVGASFHCRNFAPLYDIPEEAATGTSNGALSCYLQRYGVISEQEAGNITIEQGYCMGRSSEIRASLQISRGEVIGVRVGGTALYKGIQGLEILSNGSLTAI